MIQRHTLARIEGAGYITVEFSVPDGLAVDAMRDQVATVLFSIFEPVPGAGQVSLSPTAAEALAAMLVHAAHVARRGATQV